MSNGNGETKWAGRLVSVFVGFVALSVTVLGFTEYRLRIYQESLEKLQQDHRDERREREEEDRRTRAEITESAENTNGTVWEFNRELTKYGERLGRLEGLQECEHP